MGEFEDLIERVRTGDSGALDELQSKFAGSALRETNTALAQERDGLKQWQEQNLGLVRKAKFQEITSSLEEDLRSLISEDDVSNVSPEEITADLLRQTGQKRLEQKNQLKLAAAKEAGFESVEAYEKALEIVKQMDDDRRRSLELLGGAASGGGDAGEMKRSMVDEAKKDFERSKQLGNSDDYALGDFVHTLMARQSPKDL